MDTATKTAADYRAEAVAHRNEAADSFDRCGNDGFVTQHVHHLSADKSMIEAEIAENGGRATFPALFDLEGNLVAAKLVQVEDRYNYGRKVSKWVVMASEDPYSREKPLAWITAFPVRRSTMVRKGYTEGTVLAPAKADFAGGGKGMGGMATVRAMAIRTDGGFSRNVEIVTTDAGYEKN